MVKRKTLSLVVTQGIYGRRWLKISFIGYACFPTSSCINRTLDIESSRPGNRFHMPKHLRNKRNRLPASIPNSRDNLNRQLFFSYQPRTIFCHCPKNGFVVVPLLYCFGKKMDWAYQPSANPIALRMVERLVNCLLWTIGIISARGRVRASCLALRFVPIAFVAIGRANP